MDRKGDHWGESYNLGAPVNTEGSEFFPSLIRDGRYFFFMSTSLGAQERIPPALTWDYIMRYRMRPEGF